MAARNVSAPVAASRLSRERVEETLEDRTPVLRRTLRGLSEPMLAALARGLEEQRERLRPGRLFGARDGGGCAVGVMLRELDPAVYSSGPVSFWLRDRWRRRASSYGNDLGRHPRLRHLESIFDHAVKRLRRLEPSAGLAAEAAGEWIRREAERELRLRSLGRDFGSASAPGSRSERRSAPAQPSPSSALGGAR